MDTTKAETWKPIPDRELNALIELHVMELKWDEARCRICGWPLEDDASKGCVVDNCSLRPPPVRRADEPADYLNSHWPAWMVFLKLCQHGITRISNGDGDSCDVDFLGPHNLDSVRDGWRAAHISAETFERAICLTALRACGIEQPAPAPAGGNGGKE